MEAEEALHRPPARCARGAGGVDRRDPRAREPGSRWGKSEARAREPQLTSQGWRWMALGTQEDHPATDCRRRFSSRWCPCPSRTWRRTMQDLSEPPDFGGKCSPPTHRRASTQTPRGCQRPPNDSTARHVSFHRNNCLSYVGQTHRVVEGFRPVFSPTDKGTEQELAGQTGSLCSCDSD